MKQWASLLSVLVLMVVQSPWGPDVLAQLSSESHQISVAPDTTNNLHGEHAEVRVDVWNASSKNGLSALL
jgi:hypothetical protein